MSAEKHCIIVFGNHRIQERYPKRDGNGNFRLILAKKYARVDVEEKDPWLFLVLRPPRPSPV